MNLNMPSSPCGKEAYSLKTLRLLRKERCDILNKRKPDEKDCFHSVSCYLPKYEWKNDCGFTQKELERYQKVIQSTAHLACRK